MLIASWNVNSIAVRLPHVLSWLEEARPDHLCLQELKCTDDKFPYKEIEAAGYTARVLGEKTYNGVAILSRSTSELVAADLPGSPEPKQSRLIEVLQEGLFILDLYVPNGSEVGSAKYEYKMAWLQALIDYIKNNHCHGKATVQDRLVVCGDFNIAPEDRDVHDPAAWEGQVLVSEPERAFFRQLLDLGLVDSFRRFEEASGHFSWWDYRQMAFRRNHGLRIDHILVSEPALASLRRSWIDKAPRKLEKPSDHAPVLIELA